MSIAKDLKLVIQKSSSLKYIASRNQDDPSPTYPDGDAKDIRVTLFMMALRLVPSKFTERSNLSAKHLIVEHGVQVNEDDNIEFVFVNGIGTSQKAAKHNAMEISKFFKRKITLLYNPTNGIVDDLIESVIGRSLDQKTVVCKTTYNFVRDSLRSNRRVVLIGYSQGGIIVSNVVKNIVNECDATMLSHLEVYTFAGAQDEMSSSVFSEHFCNDTDYVSQIGAIGYKEEQGGTVYIRKGVIGHLLNSNYLGAFALGKYCNSKSRLFGYIPTKGGLN